MYNFDKLPNRRRNSCKWECDSNVIPMWIADMDFEVAPKIKDALINRVNEATFGYHQINPEFFYSFINFNKRHHNIEYKYEDIIYSTGAVPAISSIVRKLTSPAEKVILLTPVYNIFFNSIYNNGRYILESKLDYNKENNTYSIDFSDLEEKMSDKQTTMMIFCNPHNPIGHIWSKEELEKVLTLARKYNITIISDEVHAELTTMYHEYIPFLSITNENDRVIAIESAGKTYNLAGLQAAYVIVPNKDLHHKVNRGLNTDEVAEGNVFYSDAYIAAFNECDDWLLELREYLTKNREYAYSYIESNSKAKVVRGDATYLLWVDLSYYTDNTKELCEYLKTKFGLWITEGEEYGQSGKTFVRINIATSFELVKEGLNRLILGLNSWNLEK